jgi:hypothetical protein
VTFHGKKTIQLQIGDVNIKEKKKLYIIKGPHIYNISVQRAEHNIGDTLAQRKEHTKDR